MLNKSVIQGKLVADPELKHTSNGNVPVVSFCIACERNYYNQDGNRDADFIDCVAWRGTAEFICRNFRKGDMIILNGATQTRNYEDKNGNKRKAVELSVDEVNFPGYRRPKEDESVEAPKAVSAIDDDIVDIGAGMDDFQL